MIYDSYFTIGSTHAICQDYAWSWAHMAALSDGCSSSERSDISARLLVQAAMLESSPSLPPEQFYDALKKKYAEVLTIAGVGYNDSFATLLFVTTFEKYWRAFIFGDGVIAARRKADQALEVYEFGSSMSAPWYLSYALQPNQQQQYLDAYGSTLFEREYEINLGGVVEKDTTTPAVQSPIVVMDFERSDYDVVACFSDGVQSFYETDPNDRSRRADPVPSHKVIRELMAFKNYNGVFVGRRADKALKQYRADGIFHYDDFSMVAGYDNGAADQGT